jgi:hypothetical protein
MPIFDQGYQHWEGELSGHGWRWLAITQLGVRVQLKNRSMRILLILAWGPALALVIAAALWGLLEQRTEGIMALVRSVLPANVLLEPSAYRLTVWTLAYSFFFKFQMFFIMLLVVIIGPGLISRDLRFNALPLYFSRPLTRLDYFLGKLGIIGALVAAVAVVPAVFAYFVGVCFCLDLTIVRDTYPVLLASIAYGLVITLSVGTLMLAMSSLTRQSLYVGIAWAGLWIISGLVATALTEIHRESAMFRRAEFHADLVRWVQQHPPPEGARVINGQPDIQFDPRTGKRRVGGNPPADPEKAKRWQAEAERWLADFEQETQRVSAEVERGPGELARTDWRPMCSYVTNLDRIQDLLLNTDAAWVTIGKAIGPPRIPFGPGFNPRGGPPPQFNERRFADMNVLQYPWQWSACVLLGLLGLSTWTLTRRIRSLDRLR